MNSTIDNAGGFNRLQIANLDEYLCGYSNVFEHYVPPFHILANLEREIKYKEIPDQRLSFPYSPEGFIFFELVGIRPEQPRMVIYRYDQSATTKTGI